MAAYGDAPLEPEGRRGTLPSGQLLHHEAVLPGAAPRVAPAVQHALDRREAVEREIAPVPGEEHDREVDHAALPAAPSEPVLLDQCGCTFVPHVVALRVGQPLRELRHDLLGRTANMLHGRAGWRGREGRPFRWRQEDRQAFLDAIEAPRVFDFAGLEYISSAGLGVLLKTQKRLLASGGKLRLTGVSRHLQDIFQYSGFDQIFEIESAG